MLDFAVLTILFNGLDDRLVLNPSSKASMSLGIVNRGEWEADIVDGVSLRLFLLRVSWLCVGGRYSNITVHLKNNKKHNSSFHPHYLSSFSRLLFSWPQNLPSISYT